MARTFELVLAGFPVWRTAEVRAAGIDHEQSIRSASYPDAILLLPLCVDSDRIVPWRSDSKNA